MNPARKIFVLAASLAFVAGTAAPALAAISVTRAELSGTRLRVEGRGAVPNASISIDGTVMGRADGAGAFRIERDPFTSSTCTITVSDGSTSASATLSGCTPSPPPPPSGPATGSVQIVRGGTGNGRVTSDPAGIDCTIGPSGPAGTCEASYPADTRVVLQATAAADSRFLYWALTTSCSDAPSVIVRAGAVHSCQPVFELNEPASFLLQTALVGSGSVTSSPAGIDCTSDSDTGIVTGRCGENFPSGTVVTLTATPRAGWTFSGWSGDDADCNDGVVTMNAAKRCTATFVSGTPTFTLTVTKRGQGTVTSSPVGINCGADCAEAYASGTVVRLTATPAAGWRFDRWRGNADCTDGVVTMNANKTCTAEFK